MQPSTNPLYSVQEAYLSYICVCIGLEVQIVMYINPYIRIPC